MTQAPPDAPVCFRHTDRTTYIKCTRCNRPICPECMTPAAVGFQCPECIRDGRRSVRQAVSPFGGRIVQTAYVTYALITVNVLFFIATIADHGQSAILLGGDTPLFEKFSLIQGRLGFPHSDGPPTVVDGIANGQYYRLLTSMFMHAGLIHIGLNMLALYQLGPTLERIFGWWRFLAVYLLAGLGGSVATYLFAASDSATVGASGAIFGLLAVFFVVARKANQNTNQIVTTIVLNLVLTFSITFISKTGHVGGLLTGAALGAAVVYAPGTGTRRTVIQVAGFAGVALVYVVATVIRTSSLS